MGRGRDLGMLWLGTKGEKVEWLEECCTEYSMINGSSRELMRNSVPTPSAGPTHLQHRKERSAEEDGDRTAKRSGSGRRSMRRSKAQRGSD